MICQQSAATDWVGTDVKLQLKYEVRRRQSENYQPEGVDFDGARPSAPEFYVRVEQIVVQYR